MKNIKYVKRGYTICEVAFALCGIIIALFPTKSMTAVSYIAGGIILINGIIRIFGYFCDDLYSLAFQFDLALGIFSVIFGAVFLIHPVWLFSILPFLLGLFVLINGLFVLQTSIDSKRFGMKYWWILLGFAVVSAGFGIALLFNPFAGAKMLTVLIGVAMFAVGSCKIFLSVYTIVEKKKQKGSEIIER